MKAQPLDEQYKTCRPEDAKYLRMASPAPSPFSSILLPVYTQGEKWAPNCWNWNGDVESPTLTPSINSTCENERCHSYITNGRIQFLPDCTHSLAGTTHDLLDI